MIKTSTQAIIIPSQYYSDTHGEHSPPWSTETGDGNDKRVVGHDNGGGGGGVESGCTVIDINVGEEEEEKVCRICQLGRSDQVEAGVGGNNRSGNLVQLGCNCKADLALVHYHCAIAWFKEKGDRTCEICGKAVKNIERIEDTGFRAFATEINEVENAAISNPSEDRPRHQCICNWILVVMVVAFLVAWALHAAMAPKSH